MKTKGKIMEKLTNKETNTNYNATLFDHPTKNFLTICSLDEYTPIPKLLHKSMAYAYQYCHKMKFFLIQCDSWQLAHGRVEEFPDQ